MSTPPLSKLEVELLACVGWHFFVGVMSAMLFRSQIRFKLAQIKHSVEQVATISAETAQAMEQASSAVADLAQQSLALQRLIVEMKNG